MNEPVPFYAYSAEHLITILLTAALPVFLARVVRCSRSLFLERIIIAAIAALLCANYIVYLLFIRRVSEVTWPQMLPMQLCDWAMIVVVVAMTTANRKWFEVAYFWGIGGTLQAVLTPNLFYGFPDLRFICFFVSHCGIIVGVVFLMLTRGLRPYPVSIVRAFAWSEVYFICAMIVDHVTQVNYGFLLHKPEAFTLLSYLSDNRFVYLVQMHALALVFFGLLYLPFALADLFEGKNAPLTVRQGTEG